jgi:hypothetical protein
MTGTNIMCIFTTLIFVDVVKLRNTYINVVLAKFSKYSTSIQRSFLKRKRDYELDACKYLETNCQIAKTFFMGGTNKERKIP